MRNARACSVRRGSVPARWIVKQSFACWWTRSSPVPCNPYRSKQTIFPPLLSSNWPKTYRRALFPLSPFWTLMVLSSRLSDLKTTTTTTTTSPCLVWCASSSRFHATSRFARFMWRLWVPVLFGSHADVIKHNHGEDTPFRYNFDDRYPKDCKFYCSISVLLWNLAEPIKDEEFELLIKYQPCLYAESLLAHGTGRGLAWVNYMTTLFSEGKFINLKTMEIFGFAHLLTLM